MCDVAGDAIVGNGQGGNSVLESQVVDGHTLAEIAPNLFKTVSKRTVKKKVCGAGLAK
jgi:hypothetical protein